jgi:hypothetical protein
LDVISSSKVIQAISWTWPVVSIRQSHSSQLGAIGMRQIGFVETGEFQNLQVPRLSCWPIHHTPACWLVLVRINGSIPVCQYVVRMMHSSSCFRTEMRLSCMELHHRAARHGFPKVLALGQEQKEAEILSA